MITAEENEERSSDDELIQARQFPPLVRYDYDREPLLVVQCPEFNACTVTECVLVSTL